MPRNSKTSHVTPPIQPTCKLGASFCAIWGLQFPVTLLISHSDKDCTEASSNQEWHHGTLTIIITVLIVEGQEKLWSTAELKTALHLDHTGPIHKAVKEHAFKTCLVWLSHVCRSWNLSRFREGWKHFLTYENAYKIFFKKMHNSV